MKKINLFYVAICLWMGIGLSACKDDNAIDIIDDDPEEEIIVEFPTEDQMTELCEVPITVWGNGFSQVTEAFVKRIQHVQSEITEDTQVILFKGDAIYEFTDEQFKSLNDAYERGVILAIDQPKELQVLHLAFKMQDPSFDTGYSNETHDVPYAEFLAYNSKVKKQYEMTSFFDDDPVEIETTQVSLEQNAESDSPIVTDSTSVVEKTIMEEQELSPYVIGLHADEISKWMNTNANGQQLLRSGIFPSGITKNATLESILEAQVKTVTHSVSLGDFKDFKKLNSDIKGHTAPFTLNYNIYGVYSFKEDADYYLIDQEILGNSSNLWRGTEYKEKGACLTSVIYDAILRDYATNQPLSLKDGCTLLRPSPVSTQGSQTVTTSCEYSFNGLIGVAPGGPNASFGGGATWGTSHSFELPDVKITSNVMDDNTLQNNVKWQYDIQFNAPDFKGAFQTAAFGKATTVSISAFQTYHSWIWKVKNPKRYPKGFEVQVRRIGFKYKAERFTKNNIFEWATNCPSQYRGWSGPFRLDAPNRVQ